MNIKPYSEEFNHKAGVLASMGYSDLEMYYALDLSYNQFENWIYQYPSFCNSITIGINKFIRQEKSKVLIGIYQIVSPSGKVYIGQSFNIHKRFNKYSKVDCTSQTRLYASFIKYGFDNHEFYILEECDVKDLNKRERHYQDIYDVLSRKGLNCRLTGHDEKIGVFSIETRKKISDKRRGVKQTPEHIANGVASRKFTEETLLKMRNSHLGVKLSDVTRERMRQAVIGTDRCIGKRNLGKVPFNAKKIKNIDTGEIYTSLVNAAYKLGIDLRTIKRIIEGKKVRISAKYNLIYI